MPGAGRPRYFREISIADFFPRFVHAKDDGTIASRSKSRREKLVDDRSFGSSRTNGFSNMRPKDKYATTHYKTVTRVNRLWKLGFVSSIGFDCYIYRRWPAIFPLVFQTWEERISSRVEQQPTLFSERKQRLAVRFVGGPSRGREMVKYRQIFK